jgi:tRNA nucleotidyltransferase (CCA-adding enzyme)
VETISWFDLLYTHEQYRAWFIYLLALVEAMKPKKIIAVCQRLGLNDENIRGILAARSRVNVMLRDLATAERKTPAVVVSALEKSGLEEVLYAMSKTRSRDMKEAISSYITTWRFYKPPVTGKDLIAFGFKKGRRLGEALRLIRNKGLNGEIKDFKDAMKLARRLFEEQEKAVESES